MKKRLEAELISIAHRILKLKNKSEVDQLYKETQKLYETLAILKFYQDNYESIKSDITQQDLEEKIEKANNAGLQQEMEPEAKEEILKPITEVEIEVPETVVEEEIVVKDETKERISEEEPVFKPIFELEVEDKETIEPAETASEIKADTKHVALEDLLGANYVDPVFVKPNDVSLFPAEEKEEITKEVPKVAIVNNGTSKSIAIGLNDRIGFVQHLFNDSNEDFNRVISQLNTFDTFEEAKNFINEMVIPDYNYWVGEEDYIERFMEIVEKKFE